MRVHGQCGASGEASGGLTCTVSFSPRLSNTASRVALARQRSVQALTAQARILGDLSDTVGGWRRRGGPAERSPPFSDSSIFLLAALLSG